MTASPPKPTAWPLLRPALLKMLKEAGNELYLDQISEIACLESISDENCTGLTSVVLDQCSLRELSSLVKLRQLTKLRCPDCVVVNASEFVGLSLLNLRELDFSSNPIRDVSALKMQRGLRKLTLQNCGIVILSGIQGLFDLVQLEELDVSENGIKGLGVNIGQLRKLQQLTLKNNELESLDDLRHCLKLRVLDARENKISQADGLKMLGYIPDLRQLQLQGNPVCEAADYRGRLQHYVSVSESLDGARVCFVQKYIPQQSEQFTQERERVLLAAATLQEEMEQREQQIASPGAQGSEKNHTSLRPTPDVLTRINGPHPQSETSSTHKGAAAPQSTGVLQPTRMSDSLRKKRSKGLTASQSARESNPSNPSNQSIEKTAQQFEELLAADGTHVMSPDSVSSDELPVEYNAHVPARKPRTALNPSPEGELPRTKSGAKDVSSKKLTMFSSSSSYEHGNDALVKALKQQVDALQQQLKAQQELTKKLMRQNEKILTHLGLSDSSESFD